MIRLEHIPREGNPYDNTRVIFEVDELVLPEIIEQIRLFLNAGGYHVPGLEVTDGEES